MDMVWEEGKNGKKHEWKEWTVQCECSNIT